MATEQKSDFDLSGQEQQNKMRPSSELGSPLPTRGSSLQSVPLQFVDSGHRSPSLPSSSKDRPLQFTLPERSRGSSLQHVPLHGPLEGDQSPPGSAFWDHLWMPSSPSPQPKQQPIMNLDRFSARGFSEDVGLPPRQIEKPFRFLHLPPEIRNMIYRSLYRKKRKVKRCNYNQDHDCYWDCFCHAYLRTMKRQWRIPQIAQVSKQTRQEVVSLYCAITSFDWYWDPERLQSENFSLASAFQFLGQAFDFAVKYSCQIKNFTVNSVDPYFGSTFCIEDIVESVQFLAPLRKSQNEIGRVHPALCEFRFKDEATLARRLFDFSGTLASFELGNEHVLISRVRSFLVGDPVGEELISDIDKAEESRRLFGLYLKKMERQVKREANKSKGPERWGGVLRSRPTKEDE
ncbi:hypothetical protein E4T47_05364 [Aureobasidium subglaciale]|nr:hypothetical protein E4T47_05364 [Aureobasidium subglaciale]